MRCALAKVCRVERARRGEGVEPAVHGAAREGRPDAAHLLGDLVRGAVAAEPDDGLVDHGPLGRAAHGYLIERSDRSEWVSTRAPFDSMTMSSSIRTPPQPVRYSPGSTVATIPASRTSGEPGSRLGSS